jgi:hypothetical protein
LVPPLSPQEAILKVEKIRQYFVRTLGRPLAKEEVARAATIAPLIAEAIKMPPDSVAAALDRFLSAPLPPGSRTWALATAPKPESFARALGLSSAQPQLSVG